MDEALELFPQEGKDAFQESGDASAQSHFGAGLPDILDGVPIPTFDELNDVPAFLYIRRRHAGSEIARLDFAARRHAQTIGDGSALLRRESPAGVVGLSVQHRD